MHELPPERAAALADDLSPAFVPGMFQITGWRRWPLGLRVSTGSYNAVDQRHQVALLATG